MPDGRGASIVVYCLVGCKITGDPSSIANSSKGNIGLTRQNNEFEIDRPYGSTAQKIAVHRNDIIWHIQTLSLLRLVNLNELYGTKAYSTVSLACAPLVSKSHRLLLLPQYGKVYQLRKYASCLGNVMKSPGPMHLINNLDWWPEFNGAIWSDLDQGFLRLKWQDYPSGHGAPWAVHNLLTLGAAIQPDVMKSPWE